jgi:hypothetical protein
MPSPLSADAIAAACLEQALALAPDAWGFGWLEETLVVLLLTELEARPRLIVAVDAGLAGELLRAAARLLRDDARRAGTRALLHSRELADWWARCEALDPALREMAFAMPIEWLLALWPDQATRPANRPPLAAAAREVAPR